MNEIDCASLQGVLTRIATELCLIRETMQMNRRDAKDSMAVASLVVKAKEKGLSRLSDEERDALRELLLEEI